MSTDPQAITASVPPPAPETRVPDVSTGERRPRLWPGVFVVVLVWLAATVPSYVAPATMIQFMAMFWGPMVGAALVVLWWLAFSRLRWQDRLLVPAVCITMGVAAFSQFHASFGMFGLVIYALPIVLTAWVGWLVITPFLRWPVRRIGLLLVLMLTWSYFILVRFDGTTGALEGQISFRWQPTPEQKFLAEIAERKHAEPPPPPAAPVQMTTGDWPGFRGPNRDGVCAGVRLNTDWQSNPPKLLWKHRVGPGWSSFAIVGDRLWTQEQRGEEEVVVCYEASSGAELWVHSDEARFTEVVAGPGPRATPTYHEGKLYTQGAAGRLNCLDAVTGKRIWTADIVADSGAKVPQWGFAASPLIVKGLVTVFAGGPDGKGVLAYDAATGAPAWKTGDGNHSYCSMQRATLGGIEQLVVATDLGLAAYEPTKGDVLWKHEWPLQGGMARVVQPTIVDDTDVLLGTGFGIGTRRVKVTREGDHFKPIADAVWTTLAIKPYYNDLIIHKGYIYGFDGNFFTCVGLDKGESKWKARGYGNGEVLLLPDQDLLLVLSEKGEVALVEAKPERHKEIAKFQAIDGKTWNHPVIAHGKLFIRNGEEMACFQLTEERK